MYPEEVFSVSLFVFPPSVSKAPVKLYVGIRSRKCIQHWIFKKRENTYIFLVYPHRKNIMDMMKVKNLGFGCNDYTNANYLLQICTQSIIEKTYRTLQFTSIHK